MYSSYSASCLKPNLSCLNLEEVQTDLVCCRVYIAPHTGKSEKGLIFGGKVDHSMNGRKTVHMGKYH